MSFLKFRLEGNGPTGKGYRILLNETDITYAVSDFMLYMGSDYVNQVTLRFWADVEIPNEVDVMVRESTLTNRRPSLWGNDNASD